MRILTEIHNIGFLSERLLRIFKRKEHQAMTFRSFEGLEYLCDGLSVIASLREQGKNLYKEVGEIFDRKNPDKSLALI